MHSLSLTVLISQLLLLTSGFILNEQIQVAHKLSPLNSYKDVQIFHFQVPAGVERARFRFNATHSAEGPLVNASEPVPSGEHLKWVGERVLLLPPTPPPPVIVFTESDHDPGFFNRTAFDWRQYVNVTQIEEYFEQARKLYHTLRVSACQHPLNVSFVLRWGSLPLLDIKNASHPEHFVVKNATDQYRIAMTTNSSDVEFELENPLPGDWFGMAYIDRRDERILQRGLERDCHYRLVASLNLDVAPSEKEAIVLGGSSQLPLKQSLVVEHADILAEHFFKFFPTSNDLGAKLVIRNCQTSLTEQQSQQYRPAGTQQSICPLVVNLRFLAPPNVTTHDFNFTCGSTDSAEANNGKCVIDLPSIAPNEWNYLQIIPEWQNPRTENEESEYESSHANYDNPITVGVVNYTIQILLGQDAYLYAHFNEQRCAQHVAPIAQPSALVSKSLSDKTLSKARNFAPPYSNNFAYQSSAHSVDSVSSNHPDTSTALNDVPIVAKTLTEAKQEVKVSPTRVNLSEVSSAIDSIDIVEDEVEDAEMEEELSKTSLSQFVKRAADGPVSGGGQVKKKQTGRKTGGKKMKNKPFRKKDHNEDCHFEPKKVLAGLDEYEIGNLSAISTLNLTRFSTGSPFHFRYVHTLNLTEMVEHPTGNATAHAIFEVENERPTLLNFTIQPGLDIGGNLMIDFAIAPETRNRYQNVSAILCLTHNRLPPVLSSLPANLRYEDLCYGHLISNTSNVNFPIGESEIRRLVVPFPQPGTWYISIIIRCYTDEDTPEDPLSMMNLDYSGYLCDYSNSTRLMLNIRSSACLEGRCLNGGKCAQYLQNGIAFSACVCRSGWKGLVCDDGSEALSDKKVLFNFLLLLGSNGAFLPAIVLATAKGFITEAAIYLLTMLSSALYHGCDTDSPYSFCVADYRLLQFADFFSATLAFFATLVTLANLPPGGKSFLHLFGAVAIALITQHDRTDLWTFVLPASVATLLLFVCWCSHCCRRSCYPRCKYWILSVCPALLLTVAGMLLYAFFETESNYPITHSLWHVIIALALLFAIPSMPRSAAEEEDEEEEEELRTHFMGSSSGSLGAGSAKGSNAGLTNAKMAHVEWRPPHSSFKFLNEDIDML